ncbi:MAG: hypothetical protein FLDDKLPJ_02043 [Phycisphaerae bacterium]|nr:hypothetical protein [Phycisphaerae bacterium]
MRVKRSRALRLAWIPLAFLLGVRGLHALRDFGQPTELLHISTVPACLAQEVTRHRPVYRSFDAPPYYLALYGPLLYYIPGWINRSLEWGGTDLLMLGRGISLGALGVGVLALVRLMRRWGRAPASVAALMTGMFLASGVLWPICLSFRPDAAEFMFAALAGAAMLRWERSALRLLAVPPLLGAFLYKQSAVSALAGFALYLWLRGRRGAAVGFFLAGSAAFAAAAAAANAATGGAYALNCFAALDANVTVSNLWTIWNTETAASVCGPFALAVMRMGRRGRRRVELPAVLAVVGAAAGCAASVRDGAGVNYFIQPLAWACVCAARELGSRSRLSRIRNERGRAAFAPSSAAFIAGCTFAAGLVLPAAAHAAELPLQLRLVQRRGEIQRDQQTLLHNVSTLLNRLDGPVISELGALGLYLDEVYMLDLLTFTGLADQGVFDDRPLINDIREGRVAAVVLEFDLERDGVPYYQSTARVRSAWLDVLRQAGYVHLEAGWLHLYIRPEAYEALRRSGGPPG